jgi:hypothetical protein
VIRAYEASTSECKKSPLFAPLFFAFWFLVGGKARAWATLDSPAVFSSVMICSMFLFVVISMRLDQFGLRQPFLG